MSDEIERQMGDQMASLFNQREDELANLRAELAQTRAERDKYHDALRPRSGRGCAPPSTPPARRSRNE